MYVLFGCFYLQITEALISSKEPYLHLTFIKKYEEVGYNLSLYKMGMSKLTRKQILPIVEKVALQQRNEEKECIIKQIEWETLQRNKYCVNRKIRHILI